MNNFDTLHTTDEKGRAVEIDYSEAAKSYSLYGAIVKGYDIDSREKVIKELKEAIKFVTGREMTVAGFNDAVDTDWDQVSRVLRTARV